MKYFFSSKVFKLYCILYTLISIAVNIYCLIIGHDYADLWHNIDRAIVLYLVMLFIVLLMHISFKGKLINLLGYFLPLFLSLLAYAYLLYLRGIISQSLLLKLAIGALMLYAGLAILGSIWTGLKNTSKSLFNSKSMNNLSFEPYGLLIIALIVLPMILWHFLRGKENLLGQLAYTKFYLIAAILFLIVIIGLLLTSKRNNKIPVGSFIFIIVYYICFILCFFNVVNVFIVEILQVCAGIALMIYEIRNKCYLSLFTTIIIIIMIFYACLSFFGY